MVIWILLQKIWRFKIVLILKVSYFVKLLITSEGARPSGERIKWKKSDLRTSKILKIFACGAGNGWNRRIYGFKALQRLLCGLLCHMFQWACETERGSIKWDIWGFWRIKVNIKGLVHGIEGTNRLLFLIIILFSVFEKLMFLISIFLNHIKISFFLFHINF